jgi:hypothetical protein
MTCNVSFVASSSHARLRQKVSEAPFLEQYFSVCEAINSGERTPREFIDLLGTADAFKKWLNAQNPDKDLIQEMLQEKSSIGNRGKRKRHQRHAGPLNGSLTTRRKHSVTRG